jgi:hypothetical protein
MAVNATQPVPQARPAAPALPPVRSVADVCTPARPSGDQFSRARQASTRPPPPASLALERPKAPKTVSPRVSALLGDLDHGRIGTVENFEHRMAVLTNNEVNDLGSSAYNKGWVGLLDLFALWRHSNSVRKQCIAAGGNPDAAATQRALAPVFLSNPGMQKVLAHIIKNAAA